MSIEESVIGWSRHVARGEDQDRIAASFLTLAWRLVLEERSACAAECVAEAASRKKRSAASRSAHRCAARIRGRDAT